MWAVRIVPLWYSIWLTSAQRWWSESTFPPLTSSFSSMRTFHVMLHEIFHSFLYTCPLLLLKQEQHNFVIILLEHFQMALDTIQILGGNGYLNDYPAGWDEHKMNYFFWWNAVLFQGDFYVTQRFMRLGLELKRWKTQFEWYYNSQQL